MTGFDAIAPKLPKPKIAELLLITATKFPLVVMYALSGFSAIAFTGRQHQNKLTEVPF